jgi:CRP/FNR family transcriptional regulator, cyclic AMP receptor protein
MAKNIKAEAFLSGLDDSQREALSKIAVKKRFPAGKTIFRQGEAATGFYLIDNGLVSLDYNVPRGRRVQIQQLGPGEVLGWSWLTEPPQWKFSATALDDVTASFFRAAEVRAQCVRDPKLGHALMERVALALMERLQATRHKLLVFVQRARGKDAQIS